ncbi:hypothetical protein C0991_010134 [Blastosporella zonata]|nr:hypothetical protein C0991_010134 [Blastosporella zonata]
MMRIIKNYFSHSSSPRALSNWFDPEAAPSAPILGVSRPHFSPRRVHWWDPATTCIETETGVPAYQLPARGFFSTSASFKSGDDDDRPWTTLAGLDDDSDRSSAAASQKQGPPPSYTMHRSLSGPKPLIRVTTIYRKAGEKMLSKRKLKKTIGREELRLGLGVMLRESSGRSAKIERQRKLAKEQMGQGENGVVRGNPR